MPNSSDLPAGAASLRLTKAELRDRATALRDAIPAAERAAADQAIQERVLALPEWQSAQTIFLYVSFRSEVGTRPLLEEALAQGKSVLVPRVHRALGSVEAYHIESPADLVPGAWGILEPRSALAADPAEIDLVLAPGLAFDRQGGRLGYGAGYYDRYLRRVRPDCARVALAYQAQLVHEVPMGPADERVGVVVTEAGVWRVRG